MESGFVLFWSGPFSQWHPSPFVIEGRQYNCAEQFMMAGKARTFDDKHSLSLIMRSKDPAEQKRIGRQVRGFNERQWTSVCRQIVFEGNLAKFSQNEGLRKILEETESATIVEASPNDKIWGIGLQKDDPRAVQPKHWRGKNWLGEAIMQVRAELRKNPV